MSESWDRMILASDGREALEVRHWEDEEDREFSSRLVSFTPCEKSNIYHDHIKQAKKAGLLFVGVKLQLNQKSFQVF